MNLSINTEREKTNWKGNVEEWEEVKVQTQNKTNDRYKNGEKIFSLEERNSRNKKNRNYALSL